MTMCFRWPLCAWNYDVNVCPTFSPLPLYTALFQIKRRAQRKQLLVTIREHFISISQGSDQSKKNQKTRKKGVYRATNNCYSTARKKAPLKISAKYLTKLITCHDHYEIFRNFSNPSGSGFVKGWGFSVLKLNPKSALATGWLKTSSYDFGWFFD